MIVKVDDVRAVASDTKVDSVFDLANALGEKNLAKSLAEHSRPFFGTGRRRSWCWPC